MELWELLESLEELVSLAHLDFLGPQEPKETWDHQETKAALAFRALEEKLASLECQVNLEKWVHLERMA